MKLLFFPFFFNNPSNHAEGYPQRGHYSEKWLHLLKNKKIRNRNKVKWINTMLRDVLFLLFPFLCGGKRSHLWVFKRIPKVRSVSQQHALQKIKIEPFSSWRRKDITDISWGFTKYLYPVRQDNNIKLCCLQLKTQINILLLEDLGQLCSR